METLFMKRGQKEDKKKGELMEKDKKGEHINNILKDIRKKIKPSTDPLTAIDPKKLAKAGEDVKIIKELEKTIEKKIEETDKQS
jgi:hypothetical protein